MLPELLFTNYHKFEFLPTVMTSYFRQAAVDFAFIVSFRLARVNFSSAMHSSTFSLILVLLESSRAESRAADNLKIGLFKFIYCRTLFFRCPNCNALKELGRHMALDGLEKEQGEDEGLGVVLQRLEYRRQRIKQRN